MNIVRVALFSVSLLTTSYTLTGENPANIENQQPTQQQDKQQDQKTLLSKVGGLAVAPFVFAATKADAAVGFAAKKTVNKIVSAITATKYLKDTRLNNPDNIELLGKATVTLLIAGLLCKLYTMYNAAQEDADDDIIFEEEYEENN